MAMIYLVDDSRLQLEMISRMLKEKGYETTNFGSAPALLHALSEELPDLLVSDILMPKMDGVELCRAVRKHVPKEVLPILLVSSLDKMEDMVRGYEAGADDYLVKPPRAPELQAKVSLLLKQQRAFDRRRDQPPNTRLIDRYELLAPIGSGSYGTVYRARRLGCDEQVALKVLSRAHFDRRSVARFMREAEVLKALGSATGIARVLDVGFDGESYFHAMDLIEGQTLGARLKKHGPLDAASTQALGEALARVLVTLDEHQVVHRDIKPENIIIDPSGRPTLIDFGMARLVASLKVTKHNELPGTPAYLPPEVIRGQPFVHRGDLYALGVTLYESLTRQRPFHEEHGLDTLVSIARGAQPDFGPLDARAGRGGLSAIIRRLMANDESQRFDSAIELTQALRALEA